MEDSKIVFFGSNTAAIQKSYLSDLISYNDVFQPRVTAILNSMPHKLAAFIIFMLMGTQVGLLVIVYLQYYMRAPAQYFGAPPSNANFQISALNRPLTTPRVLTNWATLAATATYTIDFVHAEENLNRMRDYFTASGFADFKVALDQSNFIKNIIDKKLIVSAVSVAPAMITQEGEDLNGQYTWRIIVPILVSYLSASSDIKEFRVVSLTVVQVPTHDAPKGIGISRYVTNVITQADIAG